MEVVDGRAIFCASPTPEHQQVSRNLTMTVLAARPPAPCINVLQDTAMRYRQPHQRAAKDGRFFTRRRPDLVIFGCLQPGAPLWSDDVLLAIEITSGDDETDFNDKRAEYAARASRRT